MAPIVLKVASGPMADAEQTFSLTTVAQPSVIPTPNFGKQRSSKVKPVYIFGVPVPYH